MTVGFPASVRAASKRVPDPVPAPTRVVNRDDVFVAMYMILGENDFYVYFLSG